MLSPNPLFIAVLEPEDLVLSKLSLAQQKKLDLKETYGGLSDLPKSMKNLCNLNVNVNIVKQYSHSVNPNYRF